jgi:hypothetical protein
MSVEPLFGHPGVKLLVDPATKRVVYLAYNGILPERVLIVDAGRQYLFAPASVCEVVEFSGELPSGMSPQTCWAFRIAAGGLEPVVGEEAPARRAG